MQSIVDERKPWTYEFMTHTDVSEDCLFLNVWTAAKSSSEKRPVYVYIRRREHRRVRRRARLRR